MGTGLVTAPSAAPQWAPSVTRPAGPQRTGHCGYTGPVHKDSQRPAPDLTRAPRSATVSASEHRREQVRLLGDTPAPRNTASYRLPLASHGVHGDFSAPPTAAHRQAGYTRPHAHICTCTRMHTPTHVYMHAHVHTPPARAPTHAHTHARPQTPTHTHYLHTCTRPAHTHTPHTPPASTRTPVHTHARTHTRTSTRPGEPRGKVGPGGRRGPEPRPPLVSRAGTCRGSQSGSLWSWHLSARACHRPAPPHGPVSAASPNAHRSGFLTSGAPHGRGREDTGRQEPIRDASRDMSGGWPQRSPRHCSRPGDKPCSLCRGSGNREGQRQPLTRLCWEAGGKWGGGGREPGRVSWDPACASHGGRCTGTPRGARSG